MGRVSKQTAELNDYGVVEERRADVNGTAIQFLTMRQDVDATPFLAGLPDDRCQCPHWGYVFSGRLTFRFEDHDEVFEAGDAFHVDAGHVPISAEPGTEYVQFSPAVELDVVSEAMSRNLRAMQQA